MGLTKLGALVTIDPAAARKLILDTLEKTQGNRTHAAEQLAISVRTLWRTIASLGMWRDIDQQTKRHGWTVQPGRERGPMDGYDSNVIAKSSGKPKKPWAKQ